MADTPPHAEGERLFVALIAGGGGTRLWPKSRRRLPKQLMPLTGERSLLQVAADRAMPLCGPDQLYVFTGKDLAGAVRAQLPAVPARQIIGEPVPRNTALA